MKDAAFIDAISAHVLDPTAPAPPAFALGDNDRAAAALAIYRNNVRTALSRALRDSYPIVEKLVGADFFKAMAREYFHTEPPASPMIVDYGRGFPDFIDGFAPAAMLAYLGDVARLEWAWLEAYRAADAEPLSAEEIIAAGGEDPAGLQFRFHPSARIVISRFPIHSIWRRCQQSGEDTPVDMTLGEDVLVVRPQSNVDVCALPPGGASALNALRLGKTIEKAFNCGEAVTDFDPQTLFSLILTAGLVIGVDNAATTKGASS